MQLIMLSLYMGHDRAQWACAIENMFDKQFGDPVQDCESFF